VVDQLGTSTVLRGDALLAQTDAGVVERLPEGELAQFLSDGKSPSSFGGRCTGSRTKRLGAIGTRRSGWHGPAPAASTALFCASYRPASAKVIDQATELGGSRLPCAPAGNLT